MARRSGMLRELALGAAAGLAATWAMDWATTYLYDHEDRRARRREDTARRGNTADGIAADKIAGLFGRGLSKEQRRRFGSRIHLALGAGSGAAYAALRRRVPAVDAGRGLALGAAMFAALDEGANTALRLTPPPRAFPWQAHARGLAGHLVYGVVTDSLLDAADRVWH